MTWNLKQLPVVPMRRVRLGPEGHWKMVVTRCGYVVGGVESEVRNVSLASLEHTDAHQEIIPSKLLFEAAHELLSRQRTEKCPTIVHVRK